MLEGLYDIYCVSSGTRMIMTKWGEMEQMTMMKLSWSISYYCTPGIVDSCLGGRVTFFEECATSKGLCGLGLSLSGRGCRLSLGRSLHNILSHLPWLITKCKEVWGLHLHHRYNIVVHLFPQYIVTECPLLLLSNKFESCTWALGRFYNVNGNMAIGPKCKASFDLGGVKLSEKFRYSERTYRSKWQCNGPNRSFVAEVHQVTNVSYINHTLYLTILGREGCYDEIRTKETSPSLRITKKKVEGGENFHGMILAWSGIWIKSCVCVKEGVDNHTTSWCKNVMKIAHTRTKLDD